MQIASMPKGMTHLNKTQVFKLAWAHLENMTIEDLYYEWEYLDWFCDEDQFFGPGREDMRNPFYRSWINRGRWIYALRTHMEHMDSYPFPEPPQPPTHGCGCDDWGTWCGTTSCVYEMAQVKEAR